MLEAGWLLLFLFLGVCSLIVVALMWPSFRSVQNIKTVNKAPTAKPRKTLSSPSITWAEHVAMAVKVTILAYLHQLGKWLTEIGTESNDLLPIFTAAEVGQIVVLIIENTERSKAIGAMPRYTRKQHKEFAAFYDQVKEAMDNAAQKGR